MIRLWIKIAYTAMVCLVVPIYWRSYRPVNFLWFSDAALIITAVALWTESRLLASMMAVGVVIPEIVWNISFFGRLLTGYSFGGMTAYMFDSGKPVFLRGLSLFHVVLPIVLVWTVWRLGYDRRAGMAMALFSWLILPATYVATARQDNINWVLGIGKPQAVMSPLAYLLLLMLALPVALYLPMHLILRALFAPIGQRRVTRAHPG